LLLLDEGDKFVLTGDFVSPPNKYAILSHRWCQADDDEVTFADLTTSSKRSKACFAKLYFCVNQARLDGLQYVWVDTRCIDRKDSAELSTGINSMYCWYRDSTKCYVYLQDIHYDGVEELFSRGSLRDQLHKSE
jgi:hypothetical protein